MKHRGCPYRASIRGRSFRAVRGPGAPAFEAGVTCGECGSTFTAACRADATPHTLDAKFRHAGWQLDPHVCPDCLAKSKGEKMSAPAKPASPAAMKAQAVMFRLLNDHFDTVDGRYADDWSDEKIAKETGIAKATVADFRRAGFGEIKEDPAIASLRSDVNALEQLQREQNAAVAAEIAALRVRLGKLAPVAA